MENEDHIFHYIHYNDLESIKKLVESGCDLEIENELNHTGCIVNSLCYNE